jgi:hypothetical protein
MAKEMFRAAVCYDKNGVAVDYVDPVVNIFNEMSPELEIHTDRGNYGLRDLAPSIEKIAVCDIDNTDDTYKRIDGNEEIIYDKGQIAL